MEPSTVELKTAYHWHCDACAMENYALPQKLEMPNKQREGAYRRLNGLSQWEALPDGWEKFEVACMPVEVTCQHCEASYATVFELSDDGF